MSDRARERVAEALTWLVLIAAYVLGIIEFWHWANTPPDRDAPFWLVVAFVVFLIGYPAALGTLVRRARDEGRQAEQEARLRREEIDRL